MQNIEKLLRLVPTTERVFRSARRVKTLRAVDCIAVLSKQGLTADEIKKALQELLMSYKLVKVKVSERNPNSVDLVSGKTVSASDTYIWAEEEGSKMVIFVGILIVSVVLLLGMFRIWPVRLKRAAGHLAYPIVAFALFLLFMGVVRLIVFVITYFTHSPGLWILPNLFADCGFFESFVPLYSWSNQNVLHKQK